MLKPRSSADTSLAPFYRACAQVLIIIISVIIHVHFMFKSWLIAVPSEEDKQAQSVGKSLR